MLTVRQCLSFILVTLKIWKCKTPINWYCCVFVQDLCSITSVIYSWQARLYKQNIKVQRLWLTLFNFNEFDGTRHILAIIPTICIILFLQLLAKYDTSYWGFVPAVLFFSSFGAQPSPFIFIQLTLACRGREGRAECVMKSGCRKNTSRWLFLSHFFMFFVLHQRQRV